MRSLKLMKLWPLTVLSLICLSTAGCGTDATANITAASPRKLAIAEPEDVGMSSERLERLSAGMKKLVDDGKLAGIVTAIARHGKIVHFETVGHQDMESDKPMAKDSIFRIYSMSKPITGVALMMLYEEGLFRLADPVSKFIPEFKGLKVAAGKGRNGLIVEDADHEMTIRELMSHSGGLAYGGGESQVDQMYKEANVMDRSSTLKDMADKLAKIPLLYQPGSRWHYSVSVDVQGYLVEVLSGQPFDEFLQQRVFEPLGMTDTAFWVPPDRADRFAQVYGYDEDRKLVPRARDINREPGPSRYLKRTSFFSGGGGLVSSTMDYVRFCQMMLNNGELDGVRILSPLTVSLMHRDQLRPGVTQSRGTGFGLDFAVVNDPVEADGVSKGEYHWGGAAGTWFWIDPLEDLVFVGMIQQRGQGRPNIGSLSKRLTYQAILDANGSRTTD